MRGTFTAEFKRQAVALVLERLYSEGNNKTIRCP